MNEKACCFLGHRIIKITDSLREKLYNIIKALIVEEDVNMFFFGSGSQFNDLCYKIISELKKDYPYIKRIYVRAQFPYINDEYNSYLLESYEETYYPENMLKAGKAAYVERNYEMINKSKFCIIYFDENYAPPKRKRGNMDLIDYQPKSGTKIAYEYALKKQKRIINIFKETN